MPENQENIQNVQPKNLTTIELCKYIDHLFLNTAVFLTPLGIACILIAFSPAVAEHIKTNMPDADVAQIQQDMQTALDVFYQTTRGIDGFKDIFKLEDSCNYPNMLDAEKDTDKLLSCFKQQNKIDIKFDEEIAEFCLPVLQKHNLNFQNLFPEEYKQYRSYIANKSSRKHKKKKKHFNPLGFGIDLTYQATKLKTQPVFNRDSEIHLIENLLLKHNRSNVLLVGKNGTGKSVLIDGLAYNIAHKKSHPLLFDTKIVSVNFGDLMSDTRYRGELESKLIHMMKNINKSKGILFLDEIHTLLSEPDIINIMKPFLADGKIRVIGATTDQDLHSIRDGAFLRRFNQVNISEPDTATTFDILKKLKPSYARKYSVIIPDETLMDIVKKSELFVHDRNFPDKAIDLLNYACVLASASTSSKVCDTNAVNRALVDTFHIPTELLSTSQQTQILNLENKLNNKVFGQTDAIARVSATLTHSYIMHTNKTPSPMASFLFCGPSGVGKTKTAEEIANLLGRGFSVFNMNEYQNEIDVQKLTGAAPGYVGYESGGQLTNAISENPYTVLLFDEFEKAHPNIQRLMLQILDKGTFTDNHGTVLKFNNTVVIMATNAGVQYNTKIGYNEKPSQLTVSQEMLKKAFLPEFIGRVNQIINFEPLNKISLNQIIDTMCIELKTSMEQEYNISVDVSPAVREYVIQRGYKPELGARIIKNTFQQNVEMPMAREITNNYELLANKQKHKNMLIDLIDNKISCKTM